VTRRARLVLAVAVMMAARTASSRGRSRDLSDVDTGTESLEAERRQLQGTWDLASLESSPDPDVPREATAAFSTRRRRK
jgi:hypothetical protein